MEVKYIHLIYLLEISNNMKIKLVKEIVICRLEDGGQSVATISICAFWTGFGKKS